jgi:hypothetical protein
LKRGFESLATSRSRLPSKEESVQLFAACTFPVYSWSILRFLWIVPAWEKYLRLRDIAGILAYALAWALAESVIVFLVLVLLRAVLPTLITGQSFVAKGSLLVLVNALWAIVLHNVIVVDYILIWTADRYFLCALLYVLSIGASWTLVHRWKSLAGGIEVLADRLSVLLYVYVPLGVLGVLIVTIRNVL